MVHLKIRLLLIKTFREGGKFLAPAARAGMPLTI
jgi:hypothetical protein